MPSFGELLKRERELRQISLREISEATKINLRYLEALERNDFRHLPGGVFNKGFVRAYAQFIGVDSERMINAYLLEERGQSEAGAGEGTGELIRGRRGAPAPVPAPPQSPRRPAAVRAAVVAVAVLALAIVVVLVIWLTRSSGSEEPATAGTENRESIPAPTGERADVADAPAGGSADRDVVVPAEGLDETRDRSSETTTSTESAREAGAEPVPAAPRPRREGEPREAVLTIVRPTSGRVVCDRRVDVLDGRAAGTVLTLSCRSTLVVDAADGGAVVVSLDGAPPRPVGPDRTAVSGRDLLKGAP